MRLIVIRHYKTLNNLRRRILGWTDSPPIPSWRTDLARIDALLRAKGLRFDAVYSSSLARARETARWLAEQRPGTPMRERPELNEVDYGELASLSKDWAQRHWPQYKSDPDFVFPNGESFAAMRERSVNCLLGLERQHKGQTLLVVLHAGVIRGLITCLLDLPFATNLKQKISHRYIGDFTIREQRCCRYDELGEPSGFVHNGVIDIPCRSLTSAGGMRPDADSWDWTAETASAPVGPTSTA
ncbi:histidine phosphatase family protein [Thiorhodococcus minor]|uniref:phosphoglycerate mutase (2,3-diphosphoglycerate-dependent) n=1 Tax=Thiorhodococcus minor TaxID=57489 RepID=A0A6M0K4A6_9GAMM|nr:histidine phosphatase family protein [Thiorhodococcus minor]NEV64091.1 histidine phosphatase family protein [Thiorhodococcus minor]